MVFRSFALGGLAVGAALALVAASRAWWRAVGTGVSVTFSGTESTGGLAQALALVVLAGALLGLVLRARGRRVLGVLLLLAGAGVVLVGLTRPRPGSGTVRSRVLEVSLADQVALTGTPWPYVYALAGLLVVAASLLQTLTAARWPARSRRYERPAATGPEVSDGVGPLPDDDPAVLWRQLDAGLDPTAGSASGTSEGDPEGETAHTPQPPEPPLANTPPSGPETDDDADRTSDPSGRVDVHEQPPGVTMKHRAAARTDEQPT